MIPAWMVAAAAAAAGARPAGTIEGKWLYVLFGSILNTSQVSARVFMLTAFLVSSASRAAYGRVGRRLST